VTQYPARAITVVVVVLAVLIAVLMVSTSDTGDNTVRRNPTSTTRPEPPIPRLELRIGRVHVSSVGPRAHVRRQLRRTLLRKTQRYVDRAIIAPLERGRTVPRWAEVFEPGVRRFARRRDLAELTEAKTGFRRKRVHATASTVRVDALGDPRGRPALVALTWKMRVEAVTSKGRFAMRRRTELTFANKSGRWLVTAYQVDVTRSRGKQTKKKTTAAAPA
jgi:hypothetical protein